MKRAPAHPQQFAFNGFLTRRMEDTEKADDTKPGADGSGDAVPLIDATPASTDVADGSGVGASVAPSAAKKAGALEVTHQAPPAAALIHPMTCARPAWPGSSTSFAYGCGRRSWDWESMKTKLIRSHFWF